MAQLKSKKNSLYILAGILFLLAGLLMPQMAINNPLMGAFGAAIGILFIAMGFSIKRAVHYIGFLFGLLILPIGIFGIYDSLNRPETNSIPDMLSAFALAGSGCLLLIGSVIGIFKKERINIDFDFTRQ
ncbi:MAG: hypothetical protein V4649_18340 [Bacteroidota bacterium]